MDSDTIGQVGEKAIAFFLDSTGYLQANIIGGKYPIWDGDILVYDSQDSHSNEHFVGRVPCQIKAKQKGPRLPTMKRKARVTDLKHFLSEGGAAYLGVLLTDCRNPVLYYRNLLPFDLRALINQAGNDETVSLTLHEVRGGDLKIAEVFFSFIKNRERQTGPFGNGSLGIEELTKAGYRINGEPVVFIDSLLDTIPNSPDEVLRSIPLDLYAYAKIDAFGGTLVPIDHMEGKIDAWVSRQERLPVTIGDKVHYDNVQKIHGEGFDAIEFGGCFKLSFYERHCTISYTPSKHLNDRIAGDEAILQLSDTRCLFIGTTKLQIDNSFSISDEDRRRREEQLTFLRDCKDTLDKLGCVEELDLSAVSEAGWDRLRILVNCISLGANMRIPSVRTQDAKVVSMDAEFGNLVIRIVCKRNEDGTYTPQSYFDSQWAYSSDGCPEVMVPISPFCTIDSGDYLHLSNIDIEEVADDVLRFCDGQLSIEIANDAVLRIVSAYDSSDDKRLLFLAEDIAARLRDKQPDNTILTLNLMQVKYRCSTLTGEDRELLHLGIESQTYSKLELAAAYTLLDNYQMASHHYLSMPANDQDMFEKYPISTLYYRLEAATTRS